MVGKIILWVLIIWTTGHLLGAQSKASIVWSHWLRLVENTNNFTVLCTMKMRLASINSAWQVSADRQCDCRLGGWRAVTTWSCGHHHIENTLFIFPFLHSRRLRDHHLNPELNKSTAKLQCQAPRFMHIHIFSRLYSTVSMQKLPPPQGNFPTAACLDSLRYQHHQALDVESQSWTYTFIGELHKGNVASSMNQPVFKYYTLYMYLQAEPAYLAIRTHDIGRTIHVYMSWV